MKTLAWTDERVTIPVPPPPAPSDKKVVAAELRLLATFVESGRIPVWQVRTLMSVLGVTA